LVAAAKGGIKEQNELRGLRSNLDKSLNANPLADISNTTKTDSVVVNGKRLDRDQLDQLFNQSKIAEAGGCPYRIFCAAHGRCHSPNQTGSSNSWT
jgi:hypothetical protein